MLVKLGIYDYGTRFLDSYAILAALDAVRAGADPHAANPLDALMRNHVYSDWWLGLGRLGLTRAHNVWVGLTWIAAFVVAVLITLRPRRLGEALWLGALLVSPTVTLVVNRANNDLVIFVLLALAGLAAATGGWRLLVAIGCVALATGLKYYPIVAVIPFLWVRPVRLMPAIFLAALVVAALTLASVWSQVDRGRLPVGVGVYSMGAPMLWRDWGWTDRQSALPGLGLLLLMAYGFTRTRLTTGLAGHGETRERLHAAMGAVIIVACFMAGVNFAYRWIFLLWPAFWLWRQAGNSILTRRDRTVAGIGCGLMALAFWQDGLFCLAINSLSPRTQEWVDHAQWVFRLCNQPLQWLLMGLLAGWLLEAGLHLSREWWRSRQGA